MKHQNGVNRKNMMLKIAKQCANRLLLPLGYTIAPIPKLQKQSQSAKESPPFYVISKTCQISGIVFLYEKFFGRKSDGVFVEVGAFDGESHSNTSCLADLGWKGYYIEPVPEFYEKCLTRHRDNPDTQIFNLAIGKQQGEIDIHVGGALSTANQEHLNVVRQLDRAKQKFTEGKVVKTRQLSLDAFLDQNHIPKNFELLVVDVEGFEPDVFAGFDLAQWRPLMMIVELSDTKSDLPHFHRQYASLFDHIVSNGYYVVYKDPINTVFVTIDHYRNTFGLE